MVRILRSCPLAALVIPDKGMVMEMVRIIWVLEG